MRNKILLIVCVVVFGFSSAKAQIGERRAQLSVGVNGSLAFNSVDFDPTIKQNEHNGPMFGVVVRYTCEKYFSTVCAVQMELNYAQMGWKENILNSSGQALSDTYSRNMGYLQMPFMARLAWGKEKGGLMFF